MFLTTTTKQSESVVFVVSLGKYNDFVDAGDKCPIKVSTSVDKVLVVPVHFTATNSVTGKRYQEFV